MNSSLIFHVNHFLLRYRNQSQKTIESKKYILTSFANHFDHSKTVITDQSIAEWIDELCLSRGTQNYYLCAVRSFIKYLNEQGITAEIPTIKKYEDNYVPYIFSEDEINAILTIADNTISMSRTANTKTFCIPMLFRLLIYCGLRLSEALSIEISDIDFENSAIRIIHNTKKRKERFIVMDTSLSDILKLYVLRLKQIYPETKFLFPQNNIQMHITKQQAEYEFGKIIRAARITAKRCRKYERSICLHCFRHYFTVTSYLRMSEKALPNHIQLLSTYLGHEHIFETERYLKFSYLMSPDSEEKFDEYTSDVFEVLS